MSEKSELTEETEDIGIDIHDYDIMDLFETLTFKEKWQRVFAGLKMSKDSGPHKWARLQMVRLLAPVAALLVPIMVILLINLFALMTPEIERTVQVKVVEPKPLEELEEIDEPEFEMEEPDIMIDQFIENPAVDPSDVEAPTSDATVQQAPVDAVAIVKSPVVMKGIKGALNAGKRGTSFMDSSVQGKRFAFVIDYSKSMNKNQLAVMKYELYNSIKTIGDKAMVTLLFFSGPVWRPDQDAKAAENFWEGGNRKGWFLKKGAEGPNPQWLVPDEDNLAALQRMIYQTPTTFGTDWYHPLKLALDMDPRPDMVFFMTDGACPRSTSAKTVKYVESLPLRFEIKINTVVLGVNEKKVTALKKIAELTHGTFRHYDEKGLREVAARIGDAAPDTFSEKRLRYLSDAELRRRMKTKSMNDGFEDDVEVIIF